MNAFAAVLKDLKDQTVEFDPFIKSQRPWAYLARSTSGRNVVKIWSRNTLKSGKNETLEPRRVQSPV